MSTTLITVAEARALVLEAIRPLPEQRVSIDDALGRVLAEDVRAAGDVPAFPCSAMDGYAVLAGPEGRRLRIAGESRAGAPAQLELHDGEAIRISTGAAVPPSADGGDPAGERHTRRRGADHRSRGRARASTSAAPARTWPPAPSVLTAGTRLGAVELGAAVAAGVGSLVVAQRPRVSVLCTGDELRAPGEPLGPGEIHNSNAPMLTGLAAWAGACTATARRLPDDRAATEAGIAAALDGSDVVIISGGVSVGPHDHVKPALAALGVTEVFWSVALQPGKPTWFGTRGEGSYVFGLPGNPVSAVVTFSLFVAPALAALQRADAQSPAGGARPCSARTCGVTRAASRRSGSALTATGAGRWPSPPAPRARTSSPRCSVPMPWP